MSADGLELLQRLVDDFAPSDKKHEFVMDLVHILHKHVAANRRPVVKKFLMVKLKEFSNSSNREVQQKTFPLWLLLAEYSQTMDIRKVLNNVRHLYQDHLPFYRAYIDELLRLGLEGEAQEMVQKCKALCKLSDRELAEEFPSLIQADEDVTSVLFNATAFHRSPRDQKLKFSEEVTIIEHNEFEEDINGEDESNSSLSPRPSPPVEKTPKDDSVLMPRSSNELTIKQLCERYKSKAGESGLLIASLVGVQLAEQLAELHKTGRTVRNLSPDTVVVVSSLDPGNSPKEQVGHPIVKISQHSANDKENEQQVAMGFLKVVAQLLFSEDFTVIDVDGAKTADRSIPRRHLDRKIWMEIFHSLLNPGVGEKTDWREIGDRLRSTFVETAQNNKYTWQMSLQEFNEILRSDFNESY